MQKLYFVTAYSHISNNVYFDNQIADVKNDNQINASNKIYENPISGHWHGGTQSQN
jgi:hypothetical protein